MQSHMEWPDWQGVLTQWGKHNGEFHWWRYMGRVGGLGLQKVWGQQQREVTEGTPQSVQHIGPLLRNPVGQDLLQATITPHQAQDWVLHWGWHVQEAQKVWEHFEPLRGKNLHYPLVISYKIQVKGLSIEQLCCWMVTPHAPWLQLFLLFWFCAACHNSLPARHVICHKNKGWKMPQKVKRKKICWLICVNQTDYREEKRGQKALLMQRHFFDG